MNITADLVRQAIDATLKESGTHSADWIEDHVIVIDGLVNLKTLAAELNKRLGGEP